MAQNSQFNPLCDRLAQVIGGKGKTEEGVCVITVKRKDIQASIAGGSLPLFGAHVSP